MFSMLLPNYQFFIWHAKVHGIEFLFIVFGHYSTFMDNFGTWFSCLLASSPNSIKGKYSFPNTEGKAKIMNTTVHTKKPDPCFPCIQHNIELTLENLPHQMLKILCLQWLLKYPCE
jgi:hypothetical protein